jgi:hypothetical protein
MQPTTTTTPETAMSPKDACWAVNKIYCGEVLEKLKVRQQQYYKQTGKKMKKCDAIDFCILGI